MNTAERLGRYYAFDPVVLARVGRTALWQNNKTYKEMLAYYDVKPPKNIRPDSMARHSLQVMHFKPSRSYDKSRARIYHLPMANSIGPNIIMRTLRLFGADSSEQLLLIGNPSRPGANGGKLSLLESRQVWQTKRLEPTTEPVLRLLKRLHITKTSHLGYSYGADKAIMAAAQSSDFEQAVTHAVAIEPTAVAKRSLGHLLGDFMSCAKPVQDYIVQTDSLPYEEIRRHEGSMVAIGYAMGMFRLTNIAVAHALTNDNFPAVCAEALTTQPGLHLSVGWGTSSELTSAAPMASLTQDLRHQFGTRRMQSLELRGMHHAGSEDIDLHAAIMLQGLRDI